MILSRCRSLLLAMLIPLVAHAENVALNKPYTLDPAPQYQHCTDPGDVTQLTDGKYVEGHFWTQPGTVGWSGLRTVVITLDLGADTPISGVSLSTAAGVAGVQWPESITLLAASTDGQFHYVGDLVALSEQKPTAEGYATHRFQTHALHTHGQKLALAVTGEAFIFSDEIEVFKGEDAWLNEPLQGAGEPDVKGWLARMMTYNGVKRRIEADAAAVRAAAADIADAARQEVETQLDAALAELPGLDVEFGPEFKAILPLNPTHARVFNALARVWGEKGITGLKAWPAPTWDPLELCPAMPAPEAPSPAIEVNMMLNEYRAAAFNIAVADETSAAHVTITGLPGGDNPRYIDVREVAWTDTRTGTPVAAALLPAPLDNGPYKIPLRAGLVRQVWLTFNPRDLAPGVYEGAVRVNDQQIPLRLHIYPLAFPARPTLHFGGWDYTNMPTFYQTTAENKPAMVEHLREHFVDSPWATSLAMPFGTYDDSGAMTAPPSTENFDQWLKLWPDARRYCVFASIGEKCDRWQMGTPEFDKAVGDWAMFWDQKMRQSNLDPSQLLVLLLDEPREPQHDAIISAWIRAIRASGSKIRAWEDPIPPDMTQASPEMLDLCDVLCPNRPSFLNGDDAYRNAFLDRAGKTAALEFYSCSGPMRLFDPYAYCRLQGWDCWRYGATASYFWAFGDGGGTFSWNEYPAPGVSYTPMFIDAQGITPGKHMEACREGIEDYEYLVMLRNALAQGTGSEVARDKAIALLATLPNRVTQESSLKRFSTWNPAGMPTQADIARQQILEALEALAAH